jgi:YVTN family beta-propeller protein
VSRPPDPTLPTGAEQSAPPENAGTQVRAFVIADIRGYTSFTQEHGDEEAGRLAARFASLCRRVVESHNGRVLELRGDEALSVFESPRFAIRAAVALQQRFVEETRDDPSLPLTVGIGIDAGEAVQVEDGYRGSALNVAARLCSLARAGEVLASRELVHLAKRVEGITFTERPDAVVKGIDRPLQVVEIRSDALDAVAAIAPFVQARPPAPRSRRWWPAGAITAVLAIVVSLVAIPTLTQDAGAGSEVAPNSVGVVDAESGDVTATLGFDARPGAIAASKDAVWVAHPDVGTVTRIDPETREAVDTIPVGEDPSAIAVDDDAVWVVESGGPSVSRISPDTGTVVDTIEGVGNGPAGIAIGAGSVWVTNRFDGTLLRIDPARGEVVKEIPVGLDPRGVAVGFGSVWVSLSGSNTVVRVDPDTNTVAQPIGVGSGPGSIAVTSDALWVVNVLDDTVSSIQPEGRVASVLEVGDRPSDIAVSGETVWVTNEGDGTISRIDPSAPPAQGLRIGSVPQGVAAVAGDLWVSVRGAATSHRGGTLRLASRTGPDTLDPTIAYDIKSLPVMHVLGDGLVGFEMVGGADGASLVPDLATALPRPTDDGRTYAFDVRPGIRYSNGDVVLPSDFRRAIERGFHLNGGIYRDLFGAIVGAEACSRIPARCDLSKGIVADDDAGTVAFHLAEPDPEFLHKLTMPFAYPVPSSVPLVEQRMGIPGTGPYTVEAPMTEAGLVLTRNPHFREWSATAQPDGYPDGIDWTFGIDPASQVEEVEAGDSDLAFDAIDYRRLEEVFVRFPAQVHTTPQASTYFLVLNSEIAPFGDAKVRRALNLAVDRDRVVRILGGERAARPTCQHLPPNFPGYEPYCPYTDGAGPDGIWTGPDLEEARRLVRRSGTSGMEVTFEYPPYYWGPDGGELGNYVAELLEDLGYRAHVETDSPGAFYAANNRFQIALDAWWADYPAASNFFVNRFTCESSLTPDERFCDAEFDRRVDRALRVQVADPSAAGALWASIDRTTVDDALYVWLVNPTTVNFVSSRVGNYQYTSTWGVLLTQLWVR